MGVVTANHQHLFECEMATNLVQAWANCEIPACKVQYWAHQCFNECKSILDSLGIGLNHIPTSIHAMASLGNWGRQQNNCARDLREFLGQPTSLPPPEYVKLELKVLKPFPRTSLEPIPFYFPHLGVANDFAEDEAHFYKFMCRGRNRRDAGDELERFWNEVEARKDPRLDGHPMKNKKMETHCDSNPHSW